jgi:hypothetical protein
VGLAEYHALSPTPWPLHTCHAPLTSPQRPQLPVHPWHCPVPVGAPGGCGRGQAAVEAQRSSRGHGTCWVPDGSNSVGVGWGAGLLGFLAALQ